MEDRDRPNDLFDTFTPLGLPAGDGIDPLLRERLCRAAAPNSADSHPKHDGDGGAGSANGDGDSKSFRPAHLSEPLRNDARYKTDGRRDAVSKSSKRAEQDGQRGDGLDRAGKGYATHSAPPLLAERDALEATLSAVRSTPPASRRDFTGRGFGKPSKPSDRARAKPIHQGLRTRE